MKQLLFFQFLFYVIFSTFSFGGATDIDTAAGNTSGASLAFLSKFKGVFFIIPILMAFTLMSRSFIGKFLVFANKHRPLIVYIIIALIGLLWAADQKHSMTKLIILIFSLISLISIITQYEGIYKKDAMLFVYNDLLKISFILSLLLLVLFFSFGSFDLKKRNMFGPWCHGNTIAVSFGLLIFFALHYYNHLKNNFLLDPKRSRFIKITIALLCVIFTIAFSRGAILAFIIGFIGTRWLSYTWGQSKRAVLIFLGTVILMGGTFVISDKILKAVSRTEKGDDLTSMTGRDVIWQQVLMNLNNRALIHGHGFAALTPNVTIRLERKDILGAHNTYLQILAGSGIPGILCFLWYFIALYRRAKVKIYRNLSYIKVDFLAGIVIFLLLFSMNDMIFGLNLSLTFIVLIIINHATHQKHIFWD